MDIYAFICMYIYIHIHIFKIKSETIHYYIHISQFKFVCCQSTYRFTSHPVTKVNKCKLWWLETENLLLSMGMACFFG